MCRGQTSPLIMPPFRQPTPSPPPPPIVVDEIMSSAVVPPTSISMGLTADIPRSSSGTDDDVAGTKTEDFEIPSNFVPPPPPREVGKFNDMHIKFILMISQMTHRNNETYPFSFYHCQTPHITTLLSLIPHDAHCPQHFNSYQH